MIHEPGKMQSWSPWHAAPMADAYVPGRIYAQMNNNICNIFIYNLILYIMIYYNLLSFNLNCIIIIKHKFIYLWVFNSLKGWNGKKSSY